VPWHICGFLPEDCRRDPVKPKIPEITCIYSHNEFCRRFDRKWHTFWLYFERGWLQELKPASEKETGQNIQSSEGINSRKNFEKSCFAREPTGCGCGRKGRF
jgi:hypothetical protein